MLHTPEERVTGIGRFARYKQGMYTCGEACLLPVRFLEYVADHILLTAYVQYTIIECAHQHRISSFQ